MSDKKAHSSTIDPRFTGALLGLACGDALGAPLEFRTREEIRRDLGEVREMIGGGHFGWAPGQWTDDTAMTLCVAEGILEDARDPVAAIGRRFLEWRRGAKDVGNTIASALDAFDGSWVEASQSTPQAQTGQAAGNGSLMRTLPVALAYADTAAMLMHSANISAMTHWDPQAEACCALYCLWVRNLLHGQDLKTGWRSALREGQASATRRSALADHSPGLAELPAGFWERLRNMEKGRSCEELRPTGYSLDTLEAAVWCVLQGNSLEETLVQAANLGGDADTVAAVAGGIGGVFYGTEALPERWLELLHQRRRIEWVAAELMELRHQLVYGERWIPEFYAWQADERLYGGRNPLTIQDVATLAAQGITHILDLREPLEWQALGRCGADAVGAVASFGIERRNVPILDGDAPSSGDLEEAHLFLRQGLVRTEAKIYVHCRAGIERTGTILVAHVAVENNLSCSAARALLAGRDCPIHPLPHQIAAVERWLKQRRD